MTMLLASNATAPSSAVGAPVPAVASGPVVSAMPTTAIVPSPLPGIDIALPDPAEDARIAELAAFVQLHADALGRRPTGWAAGVAEHAAAANDALRRAAAAHNAGDEHGRDAALEQLMLQTEEMMDRERFGHFGIDRRLAEPGQGAPSVEQRETMQRIQAEMQQLAKLVSDRAVAYTAAVHATPTVDASAAKCIDYMRQAATDVRAWVTDHALGRTAAAEEHGRRADANWTRQFVMQRLLWLQAIKSGEVVPTDIGDAAVEYASTEHVNGIFETIGNQRGRYAKKVQEGLVYIQATSFVRDTQAAVRDALKGVAQADRRPAAVQQLKAAYQLLEQAEFGANFAAWNDASHLALPTPAHRDPVGAQLRRQQAAYTGQRNTYRRAYARLRVKPREVPPPSTLQQKPWVLYPTGDPLKPNRLKPPASMAQQPR